MGVDGSRMAEGGPGRCLGIEGCHIRERREEYLGDSSLHCGSENEEIEAMEMGGTRGTRKECTSTRM
jgi:hypothetical protein